MALKIHEILLGNLERSALVWGPSNRGVVGTHTWRAAITPKPVRSASEEILFIHRDAKHTAENKKILNNLFLISVGSCLKWSNSTEKFLSKVVRWRTSSPYELMTSVTNHSLEPHFTPDSWHPIAFIPLSEQFFFSYRNSRRASQQLVQALNYKTFQPKVTGSVKHIAGQFPDSATRCLSWTLLKLVNMSFHQ